MSAVADAIRNLSAALATFADVGLRSVTVESLEPAHVVDELAAAAGVRPFCPVEELVHENAIDGTRMTWMSGAVYVDGICVTVHGPHVIGPIQPESANAEGL